MHEISEIVTISDISRISINKTIATIKDRRDNFDGFLSLSVINQSNHLIAKDVRLGVHYLVDASNDWIKVAIIGYHDRLGVYRLMQVKLAT
jgi:hypothetical protein